MSFLREAIAYSATLRTGSAKKLALDFLISNAKGRLNAKTWKEIREYLRSQNMSISKSSFQQGLISDIRNPDFDSDFFIGSNDHEPYLGYFIIMDEQDAIVMRDWYQNRIDKERKHLKYLLHLAKGKQWNL